MKYPSIVPPDMTVEQFRAETDVFRNMSPGTRVRFGFELNEVVRRLRERGVRFRHPEYNDEQVRLAVIRI